MEFILLVAVIALAFAVRSAHTKIGLLEKRLQQLVSPRSSVDSVAASVSHTQTVDPSVTQPNAQSTTPTSIPTPTPVTPLPPVAPIPAPTPTPTYAEPVGEAQPFFLYTWFKDYTLIKIGSIIFFFGAAWFVSYAFEQNWIPPLLRVFMGLALAAIIYVIGYARKSVEVSQYIVLTALGSGIVFVTVLAAQFSFVQPLLPEMLSLLLLLLAISYTLWVSFETDTQWLAITAAVAALFAPQFTGSDPSSAVPFLSYLYVVAAGFGVVVLATTWRFVSLTLVVGVSVYLLSISELPEQGQVVWFFATLFCALFLGLTTSSVLRNRVPLFIDGMTLLCTGLLFAYFVETEATLPALAAFIAAIVTALIGYVARLRSADPSAVLLYASISIISTFIGTAYLFDGFTATLFFAIEATALVFFAMRYAFMKKTIVLATATLSIPFVLGLIELSDAVWNTGIVHTSALAVLVVSVCLGSIGAYMYGTAQRAALPWLTTLAHATLLSWYGFTTILLIVVARSLATVTSVDVLSWSVLLLLSLSALITATTVSRESIRGVALWTYALPTAMAAGVLLQAGVEDTFSVTDLLVCGLQLGALLGIMALFGLLARSSGQKADALASYVFLWISFIFASLWIVILFDTWFTDEIALILSSVMIAALAYGIINGLLQVDSAFDRISPFVVGLLLVGIGLLPAVSLGGWVDGLLSIKAVSLYAYITIVVLLGVSLFQYAQERSNETAGTLASALFIVGGVLSFALVWIVTHTISSSAAVAVTAALFVYTILGLLAYVYGKRTSQAMIVRAGYLLLTAVVLRLGLVDVWNMDPFWRIITFLGIGALFILAAFLERKPEAAADSTLDQIEQ